MLHIYNSFSKQKELFRPIVPGHVGIYVCGVTVYDYCHIGHARTYLVFDMVVRFLRSQGFKVKYVRNITDIDDKIIHRALEYNEPIEAITERFIQAMREDEKALRILSPDVEPQATQYVEPMIHLIQQLIDKGYAYVSTNGDVYYDVEKFETYGSLSHQALDELQVGSRVEVNEVKRSPLDFVLWKSAKPMEPKWPSPWGEGRPGWHTECSAMSLQELGEVFDIHGGGHDLKFPHHENERAQSEAITGNLSVNIWMHVGFLQINKEKMSKSLGNFLTQREFLEDYDAEVLRYFTIASHYRSPVEYADDTINSAIKGLERLYTSLRGLELSVEAPKETEFEERFIQAMNDDFNTPIALAVLFDLVREINRHRESDNEQAGQLGKLLIKLGNILGILYQQPEDFLHGIKNSDVTKDEIEALIEQRNRARAERNWSGADRVRQKLSDLGIVLEDTPNGTLWRKQ